MRQALLILSLVTLTITACKKKEKNPCGLVCDPPAFGPFLPFTIKDKSSGKDYFFSSPPLFSFSALKLSNLRHDTTGYFLFVDSTFTVPDFRFAGFTNGDNTILLTIAGQTPDTLKFNAKFYSYSCCGIGVNLSNMSFNGRPADSVKVPDPGSTTSTEIYILYKN